MDTQLATEEHDAAPSRSRPVLVAVAVDSDEDDQAEDFCCGEEGRRIDRWRVRRRSSRRS